MATFPQGSPPVVSGSDKTSIVNMVSWVLTLSSLSFVLITVAYKVRSDYRSRLKLDELLLVSAVAFEIAQSAVVASQIDTGIGMALDSLSSSTVQTFLKAAYTIELISITLLFLSKSSTLETLHQVTPHRRHRCSIILIFALNAACSIAALFAIAFQCVLPEPWLVQSGSCIDRVALWTFITIFDVVIDLAIVAVPFFITRSQLISRKEKTLVLSAFSVRLICIPVTIIRQVYLVHLSSHNSNFTRYTFPVALCTSIGLFLSILATATPHLWIFHAPLRATFLAAATSSRPTTSDGPTGTSEVAAAGVAPSVTPHSLYSISWPLGRQMHLQLKRQSELKPGTKRNSIALRTIKEGLGRDELHTALVGAEDRRAGEMGLEWMGTATTTGRASRASESSGDAVRAETAEVSRGRDEEAMERDGGRTMNGFRGGLVVKQTREWSVELKQVGATH